MAKFKKKYEDSVITLAGYRGLQITKDNIEEQWDFLSKKFPGVYDHLIEGKPDHPDVLKQEAETKSKSKGGNVKVASNAGENAAPVPDESINDALAEESNPSPVVEGEAKKGKK